MTRLLVGLNLPTSAAPNLPTSAAPGADPTRDARTAERLGFDFVSASDHPCGTAPTYEILTMLAWAAAGRDPDELTCAYNLEVRVDERPSDRPSVVSGPAEAVAEQLAGLVGLGFAALNLLPADPAEQADRLAGEVVPAVRAAVGR